MVWNLSCSSSTHLVKLTGLHQLVAECWSTWLLLQAFEFFLVQDPPKRNWNYKQCLFQCEHKCHWIVSLDAMFHSEWPRYIGRLTRVTHPNSLEYKESYTVDAVLVPRSRLRLLPCCETDQLCLRMKNPLPELLTSWWIISRNPSRSFWGITSVWPWRVRGAPAATLLCHLHQLV